MCSTFIGAFSEPYCSEIKTKYFWSGSKLVLSWIASPSTKWKIFVAHRIGEIQDLSNITEWAYYVKSSENPADIISRGCGAEQISVMNLWRNGPEWLKQHRRLASNRKKRPK